MVDIERQLQTIDDDILVLRFLNSNKERVLDLMNEETLEPRLAKLVQRRNQMQLLNDIHNGKLRVHRVDNGHPIEVKFN